MNIFSFTAEFGSEQECRLHFKQERNTQGVLCKKSNQVCYFKAKVLDSHSSEEIDNTIENSSDERTIVFFDKSTSYVDISDYVELHLTEKSSEQTTKETLKWVHIFISNAKRTILYNYHKIKGKHLQLYLNEFVYKVNRKYFGEKLFDRVVIADINRANPFAYFAFSVLLKNFSLLHYVGIICLHKFC